LQDIALHKCTFKLRNLWQNGITDEIKGLRDQRGTYNLGWHLGTQFTLWPTPKMLQREGDQAAHEAKKIAIVITEADTLYGVTAHTLTLFRRQSDWTANSGVERAIFRKR
jgi:hypothetical protein